MPASTSSSESRLPTTTLPTESRTAPANLPTSYGGRSFSVTGIPFSQVVPRLSQSFQRVHVGFQLARLRRTPPRVVQSGPERVAEQLPGAARIGGPGDPVPQPQPLVGELGQHRQNVTRI